MPQESDAPISRLLIFDPFFELLSTETNFGGAPVANTDASFTWPACTSCGSVMQYLGKIADGQYLNLLFMCENDPGMCDEWDPESGGNKALRFRATELAVVRPPEAGVVVRKTGYGCRIAECRAQPYSAAKAKWTMDNVQLPRSVLGVIGGEPEWLQADETPTCGSCNSKMRFVALLEEGPDYRTQMNFGGGGLGYLFVCDGCQDARFLWQCS